jgi:3-oxoacyl-[acyl-carrier-protein] synthase II
MGVVTPIGNDVETMWNNAVAGKGAVARIRAFDASGFPVQIAAEVAGKDINAHYREPKFKKYSDRKVDMAVMAAEEAMAQAGFGPGGAMPVSERFGVSVGSEAGRPLLEEIADAYYRFTDGDGSRETLQRAVDEVDPLDFLRTSPHLAATLLSSMLDAKGPILNSSTACTSSAQSLGEAALEIRRGAADVMLAGGCDALVEAFMVAGFSRLGALSTRNDEPHKASRPFDAERDGFVLGEGAGFLVLEDLEHAKARGARIWAELTGYGCSSNAYRITDSPPDGRGAALSMKWALEDADLAPEKLDYINAHGTSTSMNDSSETLGIRTALGAAADSCAVSSTKSMMGHLVAACGAVEAIICVKAIEVGVIPPTINYDVPDPACDLDYVPNVARERQVTHAMTNSFGFGGSNGSLVFSRFDEGDGA